MKNTLIDKIKLLRTKSNMSQKKLAKEFGVHQSQMCLWENGKYIPSIKTLKKIITFAKNYEIEITLEDIFSAKDKPRKKIIIRDSIIQQ
jgi:DNA-binding XRE family transcriptional regulator